MGKGTCAMSSCMSTALIMSSRLLEFLRHAFVIHAGTINSSTFVCFSCCCCCCFFLSVQTLIKKEEV